MDSRLQEILRRVRRLELRARGRVRDQLAGEYHSSFKGQGIDFADHRAYLAGDDIRTIDWNVTARMPEPYIRTFVEERELSVMLAVDVSPSMDVPSGPVTKRELATEIAATLSFSALRNQDKTGLVLFSRDVQLLLPPAKGKSHVLRVLREILYHQPPHTGATRPALALEALRSALPRRCLIFLISDMLGDPFDEALRPLARRHDVIGITLHDDPARTLPAAGPLFIEDSETGAGTVVDSDDPAFRVALTRHVQAWRDQVDGVFSKAGCDHLAVTTGEDYTPALHALLQRRSRHPR